MVIRTVQATRYVTPLREGGSLPAIVEADDDGLYVVKFRGAGQGPLALVAELVAGEIGRKIGLRVPEIVLVEISSALGRNEPDQEIRDLLQASVGVNLAMDYLPGSIAYDVAAKVPVDAETASGTVWFDAFVTNVDRTARNTNLLWWHKQLYLIDHGAAMFFHHDWPVDLAAFARASQSPFRQVRAHVLLPFATQIEQFAALAKRLLNASVFSEILRQVPHEWLLTLGAPLDIRSAYADYFTNRLQTQSFEQEAMNARSQLV